MTTKQAEKEKALEHRSWVGTGTAAGAAVGAGLGALGAVAGHKFLQRAGLPSSLGAHVARGVTKGIIGSGAAGAASGYAYGRGVRSGIKQQKEGYPSPTRRGSVGLAFVPYFGIPAAVSHWSGRDRGFAYSESGGKSEKAASEVPMAQFQFVKKAEPVQRDGDLVSQQTLAGKGGSGPVYKKKPKDGEKEAGQEGNLEGNPGAFTDAFAAFIGEDKGVVTARTPFTPLDNGSERR
jgi:hypothetical protein